METSKKDTKMTTRKAQISEAKPSRLSYREMILKAIAERNEKQGSSLMAIKKYLRSKFNVDVEMKAIFIRRSLELALKNGEVVRATRGRGVNGSFKLAKQKTRADIAAKEETLKAGASRRTKIKSVTDSKRKGVTKRKRFTPPRSTTKSQATNNSKSNIATRSRNPEKSRYLYKLLLVNRV